ETGIRENDQRRRRKDQGHGRSKKRCIHASDSISGSRILISYFFKASIPYPELLAYAQNISAFTSAPPNMPDMTQPGQNPPPLFFPPFPNEEKMRRGHLNAEAPLGLLGETHSVGRRKGYCLLCMLSFIITFINHSAPTISPKVPVTQHVGA